MKLFIDFFLLVSLPMSPFTFLVTRYTNLTTYLYLIDTEFALPAFLSSLLGIGGEDLAVDILAEGITPLLEQITIDPVAGTVTGFVNDGVALPYAQWAQAMVDAGADILPIAGNDPAVNEAILELLVRYTNDILLSMNYSLSFAVSPQAYRHHANVFFYMYMCSVDAYSYESYVTFLIL